MGRGGLKPSGKPIIQDQGLLKFTHAISNYLNAPEDYEAKKYPGRKNKFSAKQERLLIDDLFDQLSSLNKIDNFYKSLVT